MALVRNALWNLSGQILPLIAAIVVIPVLIRLMGAEGFGLVAIVWTLIGYFSLFDFGLGRALTKFISFEIGQQNSQATSDIAYTGMTILIFLGIATASLMWSFAPSLVVSVLKPRVLNVSEVLIAFRFVALAIPLVVINVGLRAILEGLLRFDLTNKVRIPFGLFTIVSPAVLASLGCHLSAMVAAIGIGVLAAMVAYIFFLRRSASATSIIGGKFSWKLAKRLIRFGGWVALSNFIQPVLFYLDRFLISAILSVSVMAYYVTPYEAITKTLVISSAIASSLFPIFAKSHEDSGGVFENTMMSGIRVVALLMWPPLLFAVSFSNELLDLWVGTDIASKGSATLVLLCAGVFFNALAYMPYTLLQATGRAGLVAKVHLFELALYPLILWAAVSLWGIEGAAGLWSIRALVEMTIFWFAVNRQEESLQYAKALFCFVFFGLVLLPIGLLLAWLPEIQRFLFYFGMVFTVIILYSKFIISPEEKNWISSKFFTLLNNSK